jgi:hypothetical protein
MGKEINCFMIYQKAIGKRKLKKDRENGKGDVS